MCRNDILKNTRSSFKSTTNNGTPFSSSDTEIASKIKKLFMKNCHATFDKKIKMNFLSLIMDDDRMFNNSSKIPIFVLKPSLTMFNLEVGRIYLQKLEYEMDCTDYPVKFFLKKDIVGTLNSFSLSNQASQ